VLAVCAHPDDESFGLGAALSRLAAGGAKVSVLCFTRGEASTLHQSPEELGAVRSAELEAAAGELGVTDVVLLDHPDGSLAEVPLAELTAAVSERAGRVSPDVLLVFDEGGITGHPDHRRATEAALAGAPAVPALAWVVPRAVAEALNTEFPTRFAGREADEIDVVLEVDRGAQRRAIAAHVSQCSDNPVLWRRLELQGDREAFRWLRPPAEVAGGAGGASVGAEWDARYRAQPRLFREDADETLVELVSSLPPGTALDLGAGEGRNSLWLAGQGWEVVAVDASEVALRRLEAAAPPGAPVHAVTADLFDYLRSAAGDRTRFDLVVVSFVHPPAPGRALLLAGAAGRVAEGGHLFVVAHHLDSLGKTGPPDPDRLYVESDLADGAPGLEVLRLERRSGPSDVPDAGVDVFLWARRPPAPSPGH
jgi:LmbE family N-acetylglucosaminyl deacetylase/SAM-dependent methyltransferase